MATGRIWTFHRSVPFKNQTNRFFPFWPIPSGQQLPNFGASPRASGAPLRNNVGISVPDDEAAGYFRWNISSRAHFAPPAIAKFESCSARMGLRRVNPLLLQALKTGHTGRRACIKDYYTVCVRRRELLKEIECDWEALPTRFLRVLLGRQPPHSAPPRALP